MSLKPRDRLELEFKTQTLIKKAELKYDVSLGDVEIGWGVKGLTGAYAVYKDGDYSIDYNEQAAAINLKIFEEEIIPHEVAHLVCFALFDLCTKHDANWKRICIELGGTGMSCHSLNLTPLRRKSSKLFRYSSSTGKRINVSEHDHVEIQQGVIREIVNTGDTIRADGFLLAI